MDDRVRGLRTSRNMLHILAMMTNMGLIYLQNGFHNSDYLTCYRLQYYITVTMCCHHPIGRNYS